MKQKKNKNLDNAITYGFIPVNLIIFAIMYQYANSNF